MDSDNFACSLTDTESGHEFQIVMAEGELAVDECGYQYQEDDPTYAMAREIAKLRGLIK